MAGQTTLCVMELFEQWNRCGTDVGSECACVCSKLLTKKLFDMSTQCKVLLLGGYFFQRAQSFEPELTSSVYKVELVP